MADPDPITEHWTDGVTEDLRETVKKFDDVDALAKGYVEIEKKMGGSVNIPGEDATDEQKAEFYTKLGRPESADKYEIAKPENLPEDLPYDEVLEGKIKETAHSVGITQTQLAAMAKVFNDYGIESFNTTLETAKKLNDERWANLKIEWGETKTKENIELAKRAFDEIAPKELKEIMTRDEVEHDPILVKMYAGIWRRNLSDTLVKGAVPEGKKEDYVPKYPDSPEMYSSGDDPDSQKAREYFKARGHTY